MTSDDKQGLILILAFLGVWWWQKGRADVTLTSTCVFDDGTEVEIPIDGACPYDPIRGQSIPKP